MNGLERLLPPLPVTRTGERHRLRRAWPAGSGVVLELADPAGAVCAARWQPDDLAVELVAPADDRALPGLVTLPDGARLVGHRLGKRAVARTGGAFVKIVRPERAQAVYDRHAAVVAGLAGVTEGPQVPELLEVDHGRGLLHFAPLPGEPLERAVTGWSVLEAGAAGGLAGAVVAALGAGSTAGLPDHAAADELVVLGDWRGRAATVGVLDDATLAAYDGLVLRAQQRLAGLGLRPRALVHRDLHLGQLVATGSRLAVLDLDTAAVGDPAIDVGNLLAHLDLEVAARRCDRAVAGAFERSFVDRACAAGRAARSGPGDGVAVHAYRLAALVRLVAVHAFRPGATGLVPALLHEAGRRAVSPMA